MGVVFESDGRMVMGVRRVAVTGVRDEGDGWSF